MTLPPFYDSRARTAAASAALGDAAAVGSEPLDSRRGRAWLLGILGAAGFGVALVLLFLMALSTDNRELYERHYAWLFVLNVLVALVLLAVLVWVGLRLYARWRSGRFGSRLMLKLAGVFTLAGVLPGVLMYGVSHQFVTHSIESWFDVKVETALEAGVNFAGTTLETLSGDMATHVRAASQALVDTPDASAALVLERIRQQTGARAVALWNASATTLLASAGPTLLHLQTPAAPSAQQVRSLRELALSSGSAATATIEGLDELAEYLASQGTSAEAATAEDPPPDGLPPVRVHVLVQVPSAHVGLLAQPRILHATLALPAALVRNALAVQQAHREYQALALARQGLLRMFVGTLTLSLCLAVFGAVLLAVLLGRQLVQPLLMLAQGMHDVAQGDLRPKAVSASRDEIGGLTRSFAIMTQQLLQARTAVDHGMAEVKAARQQLQTVLDSLSSGVLVLDAQWRIFISNPGAAHILHTELVPGQVLHEIAALGDFAALVRQQFTLLEQAPLETATRAQRWQQMLEFTPPCDAAAELSCAALEPEGRIGPGAAAGEMLRHRSTLVVRGTALPGVMHGDGPDGGNETGSGGRSAGGAGEGLPRAADAGGTDYGMGLRLVVFDDVSEIVSAQRSRAWGEVARRVAHEIKNPLTPIQLSAERLALRLSGKLPATEQALLDKSVKTIVEQVAAMLRLVNEFRDYARLPPAQLRPMDLNELLRGILLLYDDEAAQRVRIEARLDAHCPPVAADAEQLRQVIHNLLQNAQDATRQRHDAMDASGSGAVAWSGEGAGVVAGEASTMPAVIVSTQWLPEAGRVRLCVSDSGTGFAAHILQRAFEPYITTKARGTGLGLAVVKKIADDHGAQIDLANRSENGEILGAQVSLSLPALPQQSPVQEAVGPT